MARETPCEHGKKTFISRELQLDHRSGPPSPRGHPPRQPSLPPQQLWWRQRREGSPATGSRRRRERVLAAHPHLAGLLSSSLFRPATAPVDSEAGDAGRGGSGCARRRRPEGGLPSGDGVAGKASPEREGGPHPRLPVLPRQRRRPVADIAVQRAGQAAAGDFDLLGPAVSAEEKVGTLEQPASPSRVKGLGGGGEKEEARSGGRSRRKVARESSRRRKRRRRDSQEGTSEESSTARSRCHLHLRMDPNQQNAPDGSQAPYPAAINSSYQGQPFLYGTQGQPFMYGTQGQPFIIGTQGACSGGFSMAMMHPSGNVTQAPQPVEQADASNEDGGPEVEEGTIPAARTGKGRRTKVGCRTSNFSNVEDVNLVKSWLEISTDPAIGTGQKKERLWERIMERYNWRRETSGTAEWTLRSLQSRWDTIKAEVGKFCSFHADCVRENRSGTSDADKTTQAASMFGAVLGHNFAFMHCYELMKDEPKWKDPKSRLYARSATGEGFGEDSTNAEEGSAERRPMGRDAAKAAKKKPNSSAGSASAEYASRMQDLCLQQNAIMQADSE